MTTSKKKRDKTFGDDSETRLLPLLEKYFEMPLKRTSAYSTFDYKGKNVLVELKTRRIKKEAYQDTMVGLNKINEALTKIKKGKRVFFVFAFTDVVCYHELLSDCRGYEVRDSGRRDRGRNEIKKYFHIPVSELVNCFKAPEPTDIQHTFTHTPKMTKEKPKMTKEKPKSNKEKPTDERKPSYTDRLSKHIGDGYEGNLELQQISSLIKSFLEDEMEKQKLLTKLMPFGKYKNKLVEDVAKFDKQYLDWLLKQSMMDRFDALKAEIISHTEG